MTRNAQTEARMFNDAAKRLDAASTRIHELEQHLQTAEKRIDYLLCEPDEAVRTLRDLESTANDNGRKPDEAVREFLTRTVSELMTADAKVRRIQKHAIICNAKPDESVIDFMSRMKDANAQLKQQLAEADSAADKNGCGRTEETAHFINRLAAELKNAKYAIAEKDSEIGKLISLSNERAQEIGKLKATHVQDLSRIEKLSALKGLIEGTAKDHGISEADALKWLVNDICGDNKRQRATVARLQKVLTKIHAATKAGGQKHGEPIDAFIQRINADLYKVRCDAASESMKMGNANKRMQNELEEQQQRTNRVGERLDAVRQELGDKTQKVLELSRWHEENLEKIKSLEADLAHSRSQESPEATRNALRNVTADRDRIRTELAAIIAEANKSGRCNGDPVQLLKQGQADLDALTNLEANCAGLDRLVEQLRGELAEARAQHQKADPEDMKAKLRDAKQDYEIARIQLDRIAKTAKRCGRTDKESVIDFMNRQQRERGAERAASNAACSQAVGQLERRLAEIQAVANRSNRLACDPIALIIQGQRDHMTLTELLKERPRIDANRNGHPVSGDSKEVVRLSDCIAELQVELDEARGKYSDIVAALENETLQQLIKRTDRSAKEQNVSLKAQLEKVQTILRQEMKDHQEAREAMTAAYKAAGVSGMRHDEELPAFINRLLAQISELRTAAHECGMLPDGNLEVVHLPD